MTRVENIFFNLGLDLPIVNTNITLNIFSSLKQSCFGFQVIIHIEHLQSLIDFMGKFFASNEVNSIFSMVSILYLILIFFCHDIVSMFTFFIDFTDLVVYTGKTCTTLKSKKKMSNLSEMSFEQNNNIKIDDNNDNQSGQKKKL